jgi:hypothetical protein
MSVLRFLTVAALNWSWRRCWGWWVRLAIFHVGRSGRLAILTEFAKSAVGALVNTMQAGFVAGDEGERVRFVGEGAEGDGEMDAGIGGVGPVRLAAAHFAVDESGLDGP